MDLPRGFRHTATNSNHAVYFRRKANTLFSAVLVGNCLRVEWFCSDDGTHLGENTARQMQAALGPANTVSVFGMGLIAALARRLNASRLVISDARTPLAQPTTSYGTFLS